jgi:hypothetical protein
MDMSIDMHHGDIDMKHGLDINMGMQHGNEEWICSMDKQQRHVAAWRQRMEHGHEAWKRNMDVQHRHAEFSVK